MAASVNIVPLARIDLAAATALLTAALPLDRADVVAEEKLFGASPAPLAGWQLGAYAARAADPGARTLVGVAAGAGRWLRVIAVAPEAQRMGVGSALMHAVVTRARAAGETRLRAGDQPGNYLTPGVDERAAGALEFLERHGFQWCGATANLRVPLLDNPRLAAQPTPAGYAVRRATTADAVALAALAGSFSPAWSFEVARALGGDGGGVHVAVAEDGALAAFAAHDGNNRGLGWFGPAGTLAAHRSRGLGAQLLRACLADIAAAGHDHATIAWIGPAGFYEATAGAVFDRHFVLMEKAL